MKKKNYNSIILILVFVILIILLFVLYKKNYIENFENKNCNEKFADLQGMVDYDDSEHNSDKYLKIAKDRLDKCKQNKAYIKKYIDGLIYNMEDTDEYEHPRKLAKEYDVKLKIDKDEDEDS